MACANKLDGSPDCKLGCNLDSRSSRRDSNGDPGGSNRWFRSLPANFGRLSALRTLELRENNMITLPKSMSRLVNLQRLDIGNNDFTELPEVVGDLINLTELWIHGNDIRRVPANVEQL
ncbi:protein lap1-like [Temnothorax curvispinosus]|uniref:Protein lap1-like n=1 Tax=Temnothorax curvispinosus TaxID=300111 RepID=A0A6J1QUV4_9HYME|nr:protein lap1-like [Temnothorax curvispinosus]